MDIMHAPTQNQQTRSEDASKIHSSSHDNHRPQRTTLGIDWDAILARETTARFTPKSVRRYLVLVVERMNRYFKMIIAGAKIGCVEFTRMNDDSTILSTWACRQLFPRRINIVWNEYGKEKTFHKTAFALWLQASNRNDIQHPPATIGEKPPPQLALRWLQHILSLKFHSPILFNALNARHTVYKSWLDFVGPDRQAEWSSTKRISQQLYLLFPSSRPPKNTRLKLKGIPVIEIPSKQTCYNIVAQHENSYV